MNVSTTLQSAILQLRDSATYTTAFYALHDQAKDRHRLHVHSGDTAKILSEADPIAHQTLVIIC